jgi:hypothetical protein
MDRVLPLVYGNNQPGKQRECFILKYFLNHIGTKTIEGGIP